MQVISYVIPIIGMLLCFASIFHTRCDTRSRSNAFLIHLGLVIWLVSLWGAFEVVLPPWVAIVLDIVLFIGNVYIVNSCMIRDMRKHYSLPEYNRRHN